MSVFDVELIGYPVASVNLPHAAKFLHVPPTSIRSNHIKNKLEDYIKCDWEQANNLHRSVHQHNGARG